MASMSRRAVLATLGAGGVALALGYVIRGFGQPAPTIESADGGGDDGMGLRNDGLRNDGQRRTRHMRLYVDMFNRHNEITRVVEEMPGGVRTTTQSSSPESGRTTQGPCVEHVLPSRPERRGHLQEPDAADALPNSRGYRRRLTFTPTGVIAEETADDPALTQTIRAHAAEVSGFVNEGMQAMMGPR